MSVKKIHFDLVCNKHLLLCVLLATLDVWSDAVENGIPVDTIYLDFAKAFDTVPHQGLLNKLHSYGIRGKTYEWIKYFLPAGVSEL